MLLVTKPSDSCCGIAANFSTGIFNPEKIPSYTITKTSYKTSIREKLKHSHYDANGIQICEKSQPDHLETQTRVKKLENQQPHLFKSCLYTSATVQKTFPRLQWNSISH